MQISSNNNEKILLSLLAIAAFSGLRAQNIDVYNNTGCPVLVYLRAIDLTNPCQQAGAVGPVLVGAYSSLIGYNSSNFITPPPGWPWTPGTAYAWAEATVGISNPSYGYEYSTTVGDNALLCVGSMSLSDPAWYNPTCGITQSVNLTLGSSSTPAVLTIN